MFAKSVTFVAVVLSLEHFDGDGGIILPLDVEDVWFMLPQLLRKVSNAECVFCGNIVRF